MCGGGKGHLTTLEVVVEVGAHRLGFRLRACEQCDLSQRCGRAGGLAPAPTSASRAVISCFFRLLRVPRSRATRAACFMLSHSVVNMSATALAEAAAFFCDSARATCPDTWKVESQGRA